MSKAQANRITISELSRKPNSPLGYAAAHGRP